MGSPAPEPSIWLVPGSGSVGDCWMSKVQNYRPISLLCSISKVFEKLIYNIIDHVSSFISDFQFGFRQHYSTTHQLLLFLSSIFNSFDQRSQTDCIYLDLHKAFDTVPHNELLFKLWSIGITGNLWELFRSYLSFRSQCVSINGILSDNLPVISGVPQGSILESGYKSGQPIFYIFCLTFISF